MGYIGKVFYYWGNWTAGNPVLAIVNGASICILANCGFINQHETSYSQEESYQTRLQQEKAYFND